MIPQPHIITTTSTNEISPSFDVNGEVILPKLKSVYCNYRGRVTIYDVYGQKVHELSGILTYEKHLEIEKRIDPNITEFDGIYDYRRTVKELKVAFGFKNATVIMTNTSDSVQKKAILFGANENNISNNFGNSSSFEIEESFGEPYQRLLSNILINPFKLDSLIIECEEGCSIDRNIEHMSITATGGRISYFTPTINHITPTQFEQNIVAINQPLIMDAGLINASMSLLVPVDPNEKVGLFLLENNGIKLKFAKA